MENVFDWEIVWGRGTFFGPEFHAPGVGPHIYILGRLLTFHFFQFRTTSGKFPGGRPALLHVLRILIY